MDIVQAGRYSEEDFDGAGLMTGGDTPADEGRNDKEDSIAGDVEEENGPLERGEPFAQILGSGAHAVQPYKTKQSERGIQLCTGETRQAVAEDEVTGRAVVDTANAHQARQLCAK